MKSYKYVVGYFFQWGQGCCIMKMRRKIKTEDDIRDLCTLISEGLEGRPKVGIFSFQKIGGVFRDK